MFRNLVEEELVDPARIHQLALRGPVRGDGLTFADARGIPYVLMSELRRSGCDLSQFVRDSAGPFYVSFDIDAVDPAFAPGTGTPVPGGLSSSEALHLIQQLCSYPVLGVDLVEVAPAYDVGSTTALLAAHLLFEILVGFSFCKPTGGG